MTTTISFAKEEDFEELDMLIAEISSAIVSVGNEWSKYRVDSDLENRHSIFIALLQGQNKLFVARQEERIVGCLNFQLIQNIRHGWLRAHIEEVVVKKELRHTGIGTALMNAVKEYCKKNSIKMVKLMCGSQLKDAHRFYKKNGFKH